MPRKRNKCHLPKQTRVVPNRTGQQTDFVWLAVELRSAVFCLIAIYGLTELLGWLASHWPKLTELWFPVTLLGAIKIVQVAWRGKPAPDGRMRRALLDAVVAALLRMSPAPSPQPATRDQKPRARADPTRDVRARSRSKPAVPPASSGFQLRRQCGLGTHDPSRLHAGSR